MFDLEVKVSEMIIIKMLGANKKNRLPCDQRSGICASLFFYSLK
jgi:hypothetical protein